jgi:pilus assembly protein CpaC
MLRSLAGLSVALCTAVAGATWAVESTLKPDSQGVIKVAAVGGEADRIRKLDLELGKTAFLNTEFRVRRVSVGEPATVDVKVLNPREVALVPKKVGGTNLVLWGPGSKPVMVLDLTVGSNLTPIEHRISSVLGMDGVQVESAGESVVLRGTVPSPVHSDRALAIAQAFFPKNQGTVVNAIDVGGNQQVMIEVVMAEMKRSLGRDMTVNLQTLIETGGKVYGFDTLIGGLTGIANRQLNLSPAALTKDFFYSPRIDLAGGFINEGSFVLDALIEAAQTKGLAKVLAKPKLLARSGQSASFLAGGEVPIPVAQGGAFGSITIEYKAFGVGVEFAPTVLGPDRIYLEITPEVSEPDYTLATLQGGALIPGFVTRRASTSVELADGQSFAIAGLLSDSVASSVEKYPLFGDIPVLGALFRSVRFQRNETELVMIVTPRLVKPLAPGDVRLPTDAYVEPSDWEFYMRGALESQRTEDTSTAAEGDEHAMIGPSGYRRPIAIDEDLR